MADLAALLEKEASAEIENVLSEARQRASEVVAVATSEAETILASRRRSAEAQRDATLVRARSAAQLEASSLRLKAQHAGVESVFAASRDKIEELTKEPGKYAEVFDKLFAGALAAASKQGVEAVVVNPADKALATKAVEAAGVQAKVETSDDVAGGVRIRTASRSVIESTLFGRLEALKGELAAEVSAALYGPKAN